jgi:hypothetical protein
LTAPELDNRTELAVHPQLLADRDGEKLLVVVKATFELGPDGTPELAPEARTRGVRFADFPWDEKKPESIAYPADLFLRKPGTDVIFVAKAYAPRERPVPRFDVRVEVGPLQKSLVVFGRRLWVDRGSALTAPAPVVEQEMRYDFAWGGSDDSDPDRFLEEARNPAGTGIAGDPAALTHQVAPCIEDPAYPIRSVRTAPPPAGIGPIGRHWMPRRKYAGTYDQAWQELRAPLLPDDFDDRFNHCASPGLTAAEPLRGGEPVRLLGLVPGGGALSFALPEVAVAIEVRVPGREPARFRPHLDTVLVDLYETSADKPPAVEMVWRAHVPAPRRLADAQVRVVEVAPR